MLQVYDDLLFKPAWPVLFAMAPEVQNSGIKLGAGVVNPYHMHPALIATHLACLNEETNGDSFIMLGKGAFHDLFQIDPPRPIAATKDAIHIIHNLVSGNPVSYNGKMFQAGSEATLRWKYKARAPPQIWIGTWGQKMCEMAGRMKEVSGVMISSITDERYIGFLRKCMEKGASSVGRSSEEIEVGCVPGTIISDDGNEALELARKASAVYLPYLRPMTEFVGVSEQEISAVREALSKRDIALAGSLVSTKSVNAFKLWGTPEDIIRKSTRMIDGGRGVDRINFGFGRAEEDLDGIHLLGKKVLPYLRDQFKEK
jgi:5,10-methylenetetrahydromethanopterin reductase